MWKPSAIHVLTAMVFFGQIQNYMMRTNLSILIVAMVKSPNKTTMAGTNTTTTTRDETDLCRAVNAPDDQAKSSNNEVEGDFEWDEFERGLILSAFGYGYITTQIIGGRLAERFGSKRVYGICLFLTGVLTLLSPVVAKFHVIGFVTLRILQGVLEGVTFPSLHALTARWVPLSERNRFIARSYFGTNFGLIITFPMCGYLINAYGWESAFYVIGCITTVWFMLWCIFVFDSPNDHPRISDKERNRINQALAVSLHGSRKLPVPWKSILTSLPFLGLLCSDASTTWGFNTLASNGPSYLKFMLGVDIKTIGLVSGLPMACRYIGGLFLSQVADWLLLHQHMTLLNIRRVFNFISEIGPATAMVILGYSGCNVSWAITLLCIGFFFNGGIASGVMQSHVDLAPNFAGTLFGISNTFSGGATNFLVPVVIGAITQDNMTFNAWRTVFLLAAAIYTTGSIIYIILIRTDTQPWNYPNGQVPVELDE